MKSTLFAMVVCMAGAYGIIGLVQASWNPAAWHKCYKIIFGIYEILVLDIGLAGCLAIAKLKKPKQ